MATVEQYAPNLFLRNVPPVRVSGPASLRAPAPRVVWGPEVIPPASLTLQREQNTVTAYASSFRQGVVYFHWFIDGTYVATTTTGQWSFTLDAGERVRVAVIDTTDRGFDPVANAPEGYPARRTLRWIRAVYADVAYYDIYQSKDGGDPAKIARVAHDSKRWSYAWRTPPLDDLSTYSWTVLAILADGNEGGDVSCEIDGAERIVRTPPAPQFAIAFDGATKRVTFSEQT